MGLHLADLRDGAEDLLLDGLGDVVRLRRAEGRREASGAARSRCPRPTSSTVRLWISRTLGTQSAAARPARGSRRRPTRARRGRRRRSREGARAALLHPVGRGVALPDGGARSDADDDVGEMRAAGLADPKATELDRRVEGRDRVRAQIRARRSGDRSMSTLTFRWTSRIAATTTSTETKSAAMASPSGKPSAAARARRAPRASRRSRCRSAARSHAARRCDSAARRASETVVREASITRTSAIAAKVHQVGVDVELDDAGQPERSRRPRSRG